MNKSLIVALSKLLKLDETVIETNLLKEDGDDSIIKDYTSKYHSYTPAEITKLVENSNKAFLETANFDINEVPKALYSKIAAAALESKEKSLAKEYGIQDYSGMTDLLNKAIESKTGKGVDELSKQQIETLKQTITKLEQEKQESIEKLKSEYEGDFINRDMKAALNTIPLDYDTDTLEKQKRLLQSAFNSEFKLIRKDGKTIVLDTEGKPKVNKLGDPMEPSDVLSSFANDYGFKIKQPDNGGRGSESSEQKLNIKGVSFEKYLEVKNIKPNTNESDIAYKEWTEAQK